MKNITYINNKFIDHNKAKISVDDRGFLFADSVYELISVLNKKIIDLDQHLNRLKVSLRKVKIKYKLNKKKFEETIILLAHGGSNDKAENLRKKRMKNHIDWVQKQSSKPFKKIVGMALREDWPDKREKALNEIKNIIDEGNKRGRVIVISNRLYGSGPYKHFLKELDFEMNSKGLAPHPNLTRWLEKGIQSVIKNNFPKQILNQNATDLNIKVSSTARQLKDDR